MRVWWGDGLVDEADVRLTPDDRGLTVGDGVFETIRTYGGRPFAVTRHLDRLARSAAVLGLGLPAVERLREAVDAVVGAHRATGAPESRVRLTVTAGPGPAGTVRGDGPPTLLVTAGPLAPAAPAARVATSPWTRSPHDPLAGVKSTSYAGFVRALAWAQARGADEALLLTTDGVLCEGTGTNLFVAVDGVLRTPPLSTGCLPGVTRALVLEACAGAGVPCVEADVTPAQLAGAPEAFLSSTTREVQPIVEVDGVAHPGAGPLARAAADAFASLLADRGLDP